MGLPENDTLPTDDLLKNASPKYYNKNLAPEAIKNLKEWYAKDYQFLQLLHDKNLLQT